jgi:hypothetical protein
VGFGVHGQSDEASAAGQAVVGESREVFNVTQGGACGCRIIAATVDDVVKIALFERRATIFARNGEMLYKGVCAADFKTI